MKRLVLFISALFTAITLAALPARPGAIRYQQPDGSTLEIYLHGDEWGHWVTDKEGRLLDLDANGFYRISARQLPVVRRQITSQSRLLRQQRMAGLRSGGSPDRTRGTHRFPVLLIEFVDVSFSVAGANTAFSNMLGQKGYDVGGATGSVWDYFNDNSAGLFNPAFDVYGPVRLSKSMGAYGKNDSETHQDAFPGPELALVEAALKLDESVDFSQYDEDGDGEVDMMVYFFAGYDEAEGGPADAIWSHHWNVQSSKDASARNTTVDGVRLGNYICSSELRGNSGTRMGGIGSIVHELGHYLGLPDFYDTDNEENGFTSGLHMFSTMSYGMYNNEENTPPYFNSEELHMLGWSPEDAIEDLPDGEVTLPGIPGRKAYRIPTSMEGEYFLVECRDGSGWDAPLPQGLAVYHLDKSERIILKDYTASYLWMNWRVGNCLNSVGAHPCFYVVPSSSPACMYYVDDVKGILFPGSGKVTAFQPVDWDGVPTPQQLTGIRYSGGSVSMTVRSNAGKNINGLVVDTSGEPISGAIVRVLPGGPSAVTDTDGAFFIEMEDYEGDPHLEVQVEKEGYVVKVLEVTLAETGNNLVVMLRKEGEADVSTLSKMDPSAQLMSYSATGSNLMGAVRFTAEELAPYVGRRLSTVTFYPVVYSAEAVYVLVESGGQRILNHEVKSPVFAGWNTVDISEYDIRIPAGEDVYIGYAVVGGDNDHPLSCRLSPREDPTESYFAVYDPAVSEWSPMRKYDLALSATVSEVVVPTSLADLGFHTIDPGSGSYKAGDVFQLSLKEAPSRKPSKIFWLYDGELVSGTTSITLFPGQHTIEARLSFQDGSSEVLDLEIEVN